MGQNLNRLLSEQQRKKYSHTLEPGDHHKSPFSMYFIFAYTQVCAFVCEGNNYEES